MFDNLIDIFSKAVEFGANYERRTHTYRDHPGSGLEEATTGTAIQTGTQIRATLLMDRHYAEYVVANGLSNIQEAAKRTEQMIEAEIEKINKRLGIK